MKDMDQITMERDYKVGYAPSKSQHDPYNLLLECRLCPLQNVIMAPVT